MNTLLALLGIAYMTLSIYASFMFGTMCRRKFGWSDEIGGTLIMLCVLWTIPFTIAADMGIIQ